MRIETNRTDQIRPDQIRTTEGEEWIAYYRQWGKQLGVTYSNIGAVRKKEGEVAIVDSD
jgi:hypothetical protein